MPGYLTNRYIKFDPALSSDLITVQATISAIDTRVTEAEGNIDDLSLNIGV
jgi:hypothetical protein